MSFYNSITIIAERLNANRDSVQSAIAARDPEFILKELRGQLNAGATHIDLSTSRAGCESETADMLWLLDSVLPLMPKSIGIVIDSTTVNTLRDALKILNNRPGTILNTGSGPLDLASIQSCIELAATHNTGLILSLAPGEKEFTFDRLRRAEELQALMSKSGIPPEQQYLDPQLLPVGFEPALPLKLLNDLRDLRTRWPGIHLAAGLSNISFNMPARGILNRTYLAMLLASGLDTVICDPCTKAFRESLTASIALLGKDDFFANYLEAFAPEN